MVDCFEPTMSCLDLRARVKIAGASTSDTPTTSGFAENTVRFRGAFSKVRDRNLFVQASDDGPLHANLAEVEGVAYTRCAGARSCDRLIRRGATVTLAPWARVGKAMGKR